MPTDDRDAPPLEPLPGPPPREYRAAATLRRTLDRSTGEIETREAAQAKYREMGLATPEAFEDYWGD
jgi:hypothetical protein